MKLIRIVGFVTVITGAFVLARDSSVFISIYRWIAHGELLADCHPLYIFLLFVFTPILPIAKVITGVGLMMTKPWSWTLTTVILIIDFIYRLVGHINAWTFHLRYPELIEESEGMTFEATYSMWPSTIIALISLASLVILLTHWKSARKTAQPADYIRHIILLQ